MARDVLSKKLGDIVVEERDDGVYAQIDIGPVLLRAAGADVSKTGCGGGILTYKNVPTAAEEPTGNPEPVSFNLPFPTESADNKRKRSANLQPLIALLARIVAEELLAESRVKESISRTGMKTVEETDDEKGQKRSSDPGGEGRQTPTEAADRLEPAKKPSVINVDKPVPGKAPAVKKVVKPAPKPSKKKVNHAWPKPSSMKKMVKRAAKP